MAIFQVKFKPARLTGLQDELYTVSVYAGAGTNVVELLGADEPFVTEEDDDEDMFAPIRTQTGFLRFMDTGVSGWSDILPQNDKDRPVVLTNLAGTVLWQGYLQAETFGQELYGYHDEVELPVQCCLSVLSATQVTTEQTQIRNFAWLLRHLIQNMEDSDAGITFNTIKIQGGADARQWLLKKFDWNNFLTENNNQLEGKYNLGSIMSDMCQFWGWTARTCGQTLYLTCIDDSAEQSILSLTRTQLDTLASATSDTATGTIEYFAASTYDLADTASNKIFASTDNEDLLLSGANKAIVTSDVNKENTVVQFAPQSVRDTMEVNGYTWVAPSGAPDMTGFFTTPIISQFTSPTLVGTGANVSGNQSGFCRRQIYSSTDQDDPTLEDMFVMPNSQNTGSGNTTYITLQTKRAMAYGGGSLKLKADLWQGYERYNDDNEIYLRLGIGPDRANAQWWYMNPVVNPTDGTITSGWYVSQQIFKAAMHNGQLYSTSCVLTEGSTEMGKYLYSKIPVAANLSGYIFIDILGSGLTTLEMGNFAIEFTRDQTVLPTNINQKRPRELVKERKESHEYTDHNVNMTQDEWNADLIFASDNNMEYGYGLLMNADGSYMATAQYGSSSEHPEQHLASRVADYWARNKRAITADLRSDALTAAGSTLRIAAIHPLCKLTFESKTFTPLSITRDWREDVSRIKMIEL